MDRKIPEIEAREILITYQGFNNQLLEWKNKFETVKNFKLTRTQSDYVIKHHATVPKVARKHIKLVPNFAEKIREDRLLPKVPETVWCEKLLCESDKAFHIWGKILGKEPLHALWIPKAAILQEEKKLKREVDYSPYDKRPPMEHQKVAIEKLLANDKFILADDMGLGKTTASVIAALESGAKKILIICPATLKINWQREIANYTDRRSIILEGRKWGSTFDFYIVNYDIMKNYHTLSDDKESTPIDLIRNEKFDLAIVDEAHYISNNTAQRTRLVNDVLENIPKVWLLTGTPMTSRPINYFNLLKIVESPLTLNWQSYVYRYCAGYQFTVGNRKVWNTSGASNLDELRERTKSQVLRRLKTDILDLPEKIITPVWLEIKEPQYEAEMAKFYLISQNKIASKGEIEQESASLTLNRLMEARKIIAVEKVPYTCELIDKFLEQDKKVIVFTNFTSSLDMLHEKYPKNSVVLDGRMSQQKRQANVDRFQTDKKIKIFISNIVAGGVGITLTAAEGVIMNDLSFVPSHHSQAEDRAYRYGQKNSVLVYYPVFENTIEKAVYNILQKKKNIIDRVMGDGEYGESFAQDLFEAIL